MKIININKIKVDVADIICFIFVLIYAVIIAVNTNYYNPIDEMSIPEAFKSNRWYGIEPWQFELGRFQILNGLDVFILKKYFSLNKIHYYYLVCAFQFILTSFIFYRILKIINKFRVEIVLYFYLLLLCPGFTSIYFRLLYPERYVLLISVLIVYLLLQIFYFNKKRILYFVLIVLLSNICMYFKESSFSIFFSLGIGLLIINYKNKNKSKYIFFLGIIMIISSLIYIIIYTYFVLDAITIRYGYNTISFSKNLMLSSVAWIINDPVIMLLFIPVVLHNIYGLIKNKFNDISILDALGVAGIIYIATFFVLKLYSYHYFVPVYAFALPVLMFNFNKYKHSKKIFTICIIIQLGNVTIGINDILFQKNEHRNFNTMVNELDRICKTNFKENHNKINIYILGGQYFGNNMFVQFMNQLLEKGNNDKMFDIMSFEKNIDINYRKIVPYSNPPFRFMNPYLNNIPQHGDYILYTPYTRLNKSDVIQMKLSKIISLISQSYLEEFNFQYLCKRVLLHFDRNSTIELKSVRNGSYILYRVN